MFTCEDVLEKAKGEGVKFLRMQFTDTFGMLKNIAVTSDNLERVIAGQISFDSSVVDGLINSHEQDIVFLPDLSTFVVFPWRPREGAVARFICDVANCDGSPYPGCSRQVLKKVLNEANRMGFEVLVSAEVEFYLFCTDNKGNPTIDTHDRAGFCDLTPVDLGENVRRDIVLTLEDMGFEIGFSHHEVGPSQHEIALKSDNPLAIADKLVTFKFIVRTIAQRHGLHASFMPKPLNDFPGSALCLNIFLYRREGSTIFDTGQSLQVKQEVKLFTGGVLVHTRANTAITNPLINSYKRLASGHLTPTQIAWSKDSRNSVLRVVEHNRQSTMVKVRNPDPACNPYLALALIINAGLNGISEKISPPPPLTENTLQVNENLSQGARVDFLPRTLEEALRELASDQLARATLGEYIYRRFAMAKGEEWERYQAFVHPWELAEYFSFY
ncbi:MAG: Glutamine synthetase [Pelotomaculum sp. PtaB.Bin104]|nr:MAG: Glutamine synthetase [Pelotomaculum sp. PtaB.Bin104]